MTYFDPAIPHYVYVCYDDDDWILYIGCSKDPAQRIKQHVSAAWTDWLRHVNVIGPMPTEDARALESRLINRLAPVINIHCNNVWFAHRWDRDVRASELAWLASMPTERATA